MASGMTSIQVTPDNLRTQAATVDKLASDYFNHYDSLLTEVNNFTSSDWKGADADAFRDQVQGFKDDFGKMKDLMNDYAKFMRDSAELYDNTKKDLITQIQGLQN